MTTLVSGAPGSPDERPSTQGLEAKFSRTDAAPGDEVGLDILGAAAGRPARVGRPPCREPRASEQIWRRLVGAVITGRRWTPLWRVVVLAGTFTVFIGTLVIVGTAAVTMVLTPAGLLIAWCAFARRAAPALAA